jgi:hypothetical protein
MRTKIYESPADKLNRTYQRLVRLKLFNYLPVHRTDERSPAVILDDLYDERLDVIQAIKNGNHHPIMLERLGLLDVSVRKFETEVNPAQDLPQALEQQ